MMRLPPALALYCAATRALEPLAPLLLARRARQGKEAPDRLSERTARAPPRAVVPGERGGERAPIAAASDAVERLLSGSSMGKVVLRVSEGGAW